MKKRSLLFTGLFLIFLLALYMQPIWFPQEPAEDETTKQLPRTPPATNLNYETIETEGFAHWIEKDLDAFEQDYGQPEESMASGFSFTINRYLIDDELLEVNSEDKVIKSIKYLGEEDDTIKPFKFGMTMDELSKIAMVYPNFTIDYQDETIDLELEEDDMNYRPLIAFDNGTFAILFFEQMQGESQLYAVDYLDSETLLKLAPYTVADDQGPRYAQEKGSDWEEIHQFKRQQTSDFLQLLRKRKEQPTFSLDSNLQMTSEKTLATFINDKEDILTTERLQELQRFEEEEPGTFMLNDSEMTDLLDDPSISGHFEMPVYDPSFSVLSWYSTPRLNERLLASNEASLAVAFSKENVLILWKELDYQTEESESN